MTLHKDFEVEVKFGKNKSKFPCGCCVRQGESLAPTLSILVMQLAAEAIAVEFKNNDVNIPEMKVLVSSERVIRKHKPNQIATMDRLAMLMLLHVDDGATPFGSRRDTIIGTQIYIDMMAKFGIIVHTGKDSKESKTKATPPPELKL